MRRYLLLILFCVFIISGCVTPVSIDKANSIPKNRILNDSLIKIKEGTVSVTFTRDLGGQAYACPLTISVDNQRAFEICEGEGIIIYLEPREHFFKLELICNAPFMSKDKPILLDSISTVLVIDEPQTIRLSGMEEYKITLIRIK